MSLSLFLLQIEVIVRVVIIEIPELHVVVLHVDLRGKTGSGGRGEVGAGFHPRALMSRERNFGRGGSGGGDGGGGWG